MRKVVPAIEVARLWAIQAQSEARTQRDNFYFNGKTIYSYGSHFPIARIMEGGCLFTLQGYSNTTAKHIRLAQYAASRRGLNVVYCYDIDRPEVSLKHWEESMKHTIEEIKNPNNRKFDGRVYSLEAQAAQVRKYCEFLNIELSFEFSTLLAFVEAGNVVEKLRTK